MAEVMLVLLLLFVRAALRSMVRSVRRYRLRQELKMKRELLETERQIYRLRQLNALDAAWGYEVIQRRESVETSARLLKGSGREIRR